MRKGEAFNGRKHRREEFGRGVEYSESRSQSDWREEEYVEPPETFIAQANANDESIFERFSRNNFRTRSSSMRRCSRGIRSGRAARLEQSAVFKWWLGGRLNAAVKFVDRHLESRGDKNAIVWVPELEEDETEEVTYYELHRRVNEFAALLKDFVASSRRTASRSISRWFRPPRVDARVRAARRDPLAGVRWLQRPRCGQRIADAQSTVLVTIDAYYRDGELIDDKIKADDAMEAARRKGSKWRRCWCWAPHPRRDPLRERDGRGTDYFVDELLENYTGQQVEPESMAAKDVVLDVHERTTGRPKGAEHSIGGYRAARRGHFEVLLPGHRSRRHLRALPEYGLDRPVTPTSSTGRWPWGSTTVTTKASRRIRNRPAMADRRETWALDISRPRRRRSGCCARWVRTSRPSTTSASRR